MKVIKARDYKEMSRKGAKIILDEILKVPNITIGFATGSTPVGLYKELIRSYKKKKIDFSKIKTFNLDEYYSIKKRNKNSCNYYMSKNFFDKVNIKETNINMLNGETKNPTRECRNYEDKIKKNPIDIQILGVGVNGHIAFNEPGSDFNSKTRVVELAPETIKNMKVPKKALTIGIKTIFSAKKIILLASGKSKAKAVKCLIKNRANKNCPVSFLKKHKNLVVIIDRKAGCLL